MTEGENKQLVHKLAEDIAKLIENWIKLIKRKNMKIFDKDFLGIYFIHWDRIDIVY